MSSKQKKTFPPEAMGPTSLTLFGKVGYYVAVHRQGVFGWYDKIRGKVVLEEVRIGKHKGQHGVWNVNDRRWNKNISLLPPLGEKLIELIMLLSGIKQVTTPPVEKQQPPFKNAPPSKTGGVDQDIKKYGV